MASNQNHPGAGGLGGKTHRPRGSTRPSLAPLSGRPPHRTARPDIPPHQSTVPLPPPGGTLPLSRAPAPDIAQPPKPGGPAAGSPVSIPNAAPAPKPGGTEQPAQSSTTSLFAAITPGTVAPPKPDSTGAAHEIAEPGYTPPPGPGNKIVFTGAAMPGGAQPPEPGSTPLPAPDDAAPALPGDTPQPGEMPAPDDIRPPGDALPPDDTQPPEPVVRVPRRGIRVLVAVLVPVFAIVLVISLWQIFSIQFEYSEAAGEYEDLRRQVFIAPPAQSAAASAPAAQEAAPEETPVEITLDSVMGMNPECTGWIDIPNTSLSYPFVRAADNDKYLNRTFLGKQNSAGAIFMDYRNPANLVAPHLILYGHNMKNGSMFGLLPKYLDAAYLQAHPTLIIYNKDRAYTYQVFSARVSDAYDASYRIDFSSTEDLAAFATAYGAPAGTSQMLTLSTCTNVQDEERILVHAALVGTA